MAIDYLKEILAIDAGDSCGYAHFIPRAYKRANGNFKPLRICGTVTPKELLELLQTLYTQDCFPELVLLESIPLVHPTFRQQAIMSQLEQVLQKFISKEQLHFIAPATWKPVARKKKWHPNLKDQHQKDAYNILRYYIWSTLKIDIGEYL